MLEVRISTQYCDRQLPLRGIDSLVFSLALSFLFIVICVKLAIFIFFNIVEISQSITLSIYRVSKANHKSARMHIKLIKLNEKVLYRFVNNHDN